MKIYPKRKKWSAKGDCGYVLIIGGSKQYSGSPVFNAMSALRAGADLITIAGPKRAMDIAATYGPEMITYPLWGDDLKREHLLEILEIAPKFNSLIIGGGLSRKEETYKAIRTIINNIDLPMVIDAEAIRAVAEDISAIKNKKIVLTPHSEEFKILTGEEVKPEVKDRKEKVKKWAEQLESVILLKGYIDIISDGKKTAFNKTGSPLMAKGGFGDTLSGICGALLARGIRPFEAAKYAAYINGKAGELATKKYGEGVLASDIFQFIPEVIKKL
ncbi:MAG: putative sugar kinase [Parcubacteria group bacterium Athens1014_10]|nr:MAG: putative sugar kinase [Parcubacteria group bacterium Athens1014_10]TSD05003.1 MAG: putative sugar kinase [Parcubacteria group bacterium Athens0714_12]